MQHSRCLAFRPRTAATLYWLPSRQACQSSKPPSPVFTLIRLRLLSICSSFLAIIYSKHHSFVWPLQTTLRWSRRFSVDIHTYPVQAQTTISEDEPSCQAIVHLVVLVQAISSRLPSASRDRRNQLGVNGRPCATDCISRICTARSLQGPLLALWIFI
jgi:hypothetical protein